MKTLFTIIIFATLTNLSIAQISASGAGSITLLPSGVQSKFNSSLGSNNVALGSNALKVNTGSGNTALGGFSMSSNQTGGTNTAIGFVSLTFNTLGENNTAIGAYSLYSNQSSFNTALGANSLSSNTTGSQNVAAGFDALEQNQIGQDNVGVGYQSLMSNNNGNFNVGIGTNALILNNSGSANVAIGYQAGYKNNNSYNLALGYRAMYFNTDGYQNTAVGSNAGMSNILGYNNTCLGFASNVSAPLLFNATAIGSNAIVDASNKVRIGDVNVVAIEGQVAWSNPSDKRLKENIIYSNRLGLDFISRLQTVSYNYIADKNKIRYDGFIAQDIEQIIKDLNVPFSGLKKSADGMFSLAYSDFVMPLVNAVQELKKENDELRMKITKIDELDKLKLEIASLKNQLNDLNLNKRL